MTHVPGISSLKEGKYKIKNLNLSGVGGGCDDGHIAIPRYDLFLLLARKLETGHVRIGFTTFNQHSFTYLVYGIQL